MIIPGIFLMQLAMREASCGTICDVCLESEDRATGRALCETVGSIPSLFAPMLAAFLITAFGGINADGIRPLYWIQFAARCLLFLYLLSQLKEIVRKKSGKKDSSFIDDFREVFDRGIALKRFIIIYTSWMFIFSMIRPFRVPFAHEMKNADQFIIGIMAICTILIPIFFATPLGRLSDKIGRKKVFYALAPIVALSNLLLVFAPSDLILIVSSILFGFQSIINMTVIYSSIADLVPMDCIGRWRGIVYLFGGLGGIIAPIAGGILWESFGPNYVFLIASGISLLIMPIMSTMPETLKLQKQR
jgi:MFS family permease